MILRVQPLQIALEERDVDRKRKLMLYFWKTSTLGVAALELEGGDVERLAASEVASTSDGSLSSIAQ